MEFVAARLARGARASARILEIFCFGLHHLTVNGSTSTNESLYGISANEHPDEVEL